MKTELNTPDSFAQGLAKIVRRVNLVAPLLVVSALALLVVSVIQINKAITLTGEVRTNNTAASKIKVAQQPIKAAQYQEMANTLSRMNPAVHIEVSDKGNALQVYILNPEALPEFVYMMTTIQSEKPGIIWSAKTICLKKCGSGHAAAAEIQGYTQLLNM